MLEEFFFGGADTAEACFLIAPIVAKGLLEILGKRGYSGARETWQRVEEKAKRIDRFFSQHPDKNVRWKYTQRMMSLTPTMEEARRRVEYFAGPPHDNLTDTMGAVEAHLRGLEAAMLFLQYPAQPAPAA